MLRAYTTPEEVRAILGVNSLELTDATLSVRGYYTVATMGLEDIAQGIPALFTTVSALPASDRTAQQARFFDLVSLYAPYLIAKQLLVSLPMFAVLEVTDGRASFTRQRDAYMSVASGVDGMMQAIKLRLAAAFNTLEGSANAVTTATRFTTMLTASLSVDPVTNA